MKIIVAVIVYDRFHNIEEWVRCWKKCETQDSQLIIIHNFKNETDKTKYKEFCKGAEVHYIARPNVGMDIGALQDVCRGRLEGFPNEWDYLLWITDDVFPMSKKFIRHFFNKLENNKNIGVACLEVSKEVKLHIRTTGFMMGQETASKITFPADPIINKAQCYDFEHRSNKAFYEQIKAMGKEVIQIQPLKEACLWDTHIRANLMRKAEFRAIFPRN